jgi:hypothetical protein
MLSFWLAERGHTLVHARECRCDSEALPSQVDVAPLKGLELTLAKAGCQRKHKERTEGCVFCRGKQGASIVGAQMLHLASTSSRRRNQASYVPIHQLPAQGILQGGM